MRPVGQVVKTSPSHGGLRGSTPLRVTNKKGHPSGVLFTLRKEQRSRTRTGASVERKSCGLSSRERYKRTERGLAVRRMGPTGADVNSPTGNQQRSRTQKGASVGRKSCGLSSRERYKRTERGLAVRRMGPTGAAVNSLMGYQQKQKDNLKSRGCLFFRYIEREMFRNQSYLPCFTETLNLFYFFAS